MEIKKMKLDLLKPADYNPRMDLQPGDPEYENLKQSIQRFGHVQPIVWNESTGHIVGGHQSLKVLRDLGGGGRRRVCCSTYGRGRRESFEYRTEQDQREVGYGQAF